jgi:hypothetical protein
MSVRPQRLVVPLVAVVALTGCGSGGHPSRPAARGSAPLVATTATTRPDGAGRALVANRRSHLIALASDGRGDLLGIWSRGWSARPPEAFAVRTASGRVAIAAAPSGASVAGAVPGGWVVSSANGRRLGLVGRDALESPLGLSATPTRPRPGDVRVANRRQLYRPSTGRLYRLATQPPVPDPLDGYLTPDGALVTVGSTPHRAAWATQSGRRTSSGRWSPFQSADAVAGAGEHIAVVLGRNLGNGVDANRVAGIASSRDGGWTWRVRFAPPAIDEALDVVVMPDGTVFVATGSGPLLRARPGRPIEILPGIQPYLLARCRDRLYALTASNGRITRPRLHVSDDDGRTWSRVPLPGRGR